MSNELSVEQAGTEQNASTRWDFSELLSSAQIRQELSQNIVLEAILEVPQIKRHQTRIAAKIILDLVHAGKIDGRDRPVRVLEIGSALGSAKINFSDAWHRLSKSSPVDLDYQYASLDLATADDSKAVSLDQIKELVLAELSEFSNETMQSFDKEWSNAIRAKDPKAQISLLYNAIHSVFSSNLSFLFKEKLTVNTGLGADLEADVNDGYDAIVIYRNGLWRALFNSGHSRYVAMHTIASFMSSQLVQGKQCAIILFDPSVAPTSYSSYGPDMWEFWNSILLTYTEEGPDNWGIEPSMLRRIMFGQNTPTGVYASSLPEYFPDKEILNIDFQHVGLEYANGTTLDQEPFSATVWLPSAISILNALSQQQPGVKLASTVLAPLQSLDSLKFNPNALVTFTNISPMSSENTDLSEPHDICAYVALTNYSENSDDSVIDENEIKDEEPFIVLENTEEDVENTEEDVDLKLIKALEGLEEDESDDANDLDDSLEYDDSLVDTDHGIG